MGCDGELVVAVGSDCGEASRGGVGDGGGSDEAKSLAILLSDFADRGEGSAVGQPIDATVVDTPAAGPGRGGGGGISDEAVERGGVH